MGVSVRVADGLRSDGHDVEHLSELRLNELADRLVFERGAVERRVIVTFDLDFGELAAFATGPTPSVISLRLDDQSAPNALRRVRVAIKRCGDSLTAGAIVCVEQTRCR